MQSGMEGGGAVGGLGIVIYLIMMACGIGSLVCWILVLINIFKESVGLGVLGIICWLFVFIYRWGDVFECGIRKVMIWWTVFFVGSVVLQFVAIAVIGAGAAAAARGGA